MKKLVVTILAAAGLCSMALIDVSEKDKDFAREAADVSMLEVKLGELTQKRAVTAEVKKLADRMVADHTKANNELKAWASKKGVSLPEGLSEKSQQKFGDLAAKSTADFDKAYSQAMVDDHEKVIKMFEKQAKDGDDPDLRTWAAKTEPILEHHLHMSKEATQVLRK